MAKLIRVLMLRSAESYIAGDSYNLQPHIADELIASGKARAVQVSGPTEIKPAGPSEIKQPKKKLSSSR